MPHPAERRALGAGAALVGTGMLRVLAHPAGRRRSPSPGSRSRRAGHRPRSRTPRACEGPQRCARLRLCGRRSQGRGGQGRGGRRGFSGHAAGRVAARCSPEGGRAAGPSLSCKHKALSNTNTGLTLVHEASDVPEALPARRRAVGLVLVPLKRPLYSTDAAPHQGQFQQLKT